MRRPPKRGHHWTGAQEAAGPALSLDVLTRARPRSGSAGGPPSEVLARVRHGVDRPAGLRPLPGDERADVDDPLALLARDPCPVVRVGRVGQVLVLPELVEG